MSEELEKSAGSISESEDDKAFLDAASNLIRDAIGDPKQLVREFWEVARVGAMSNRVLDLPRYQQIYKALRNHPDIKVAISVATSVAPEHGIPSHIREIDQHYNIHD